MLHLDFETRSRCELKSAGADVYAEDPSTEVLCAGFAFDDEPADVIVFGQSLFNAGAAQAQIERVTQYVQAGGVVVAHNSAFEWLIWNRVLHTRFGWPALPAHQMQCTMAMAYAMALPGALDSLATVLGVVQQKDMAGKGVMLRLSKPQKDGTFINDPAKLERLYAYCKQDVETERAVHQRLRPLSEHETRIWNLDHAINRRGVAIDSPTIRRSMELVQHEQARLDAEILRITAGSVSSPSEVGRLHGWISQHGVDFNGIGKADVVDLLASEQLPAQVRSALLIRQEYAKSSTAKLVAMADRCGRDGRMRGLLQYHGAATGRWAGRGPQVQNFPRPKLKRHSIERAAELLHPCNRDLIELLYGQPLQVVSDCLRSMIVADKGKQFYSADFSNIEGRVLAWLAGEEWKLAAFRDFDAKVGPDLYVLAYSRAFRCPVESVADDQRQIGKVMELALGFQGGVGAFQTMARVYNVVVSDAQADQFKVAWRKQHPSVVAYWPELQTAAMAAVSSPGTIHVAGRIRYLAKDGHLWCQLPSKRVLCYPFPLIVDGDYGPKLTYMGEDSYTKRWTRIDTYGGKLAENVTQAVARDVMADAMLRIDPDYPIVFSVHDEIVSEVDQSTDALPAFCNLMSQRPEWAGDLPIAVAGWAGKRYRK